MKLDIDPRPGLLCCMVVGLCGLQHWAQASILQTPEKPWTFALANTPPAECHCQWQNRELTLISCSDSAHQRDHKETIVFLQLASAAAPMDQPAKFQMSLKVKGMPPYTRHTCHRCLRLTGREDPQVPFVHACSLCVRRLIAKPCPPNPLIFSMEICPHPRQS